MKINISKILGISAAGILFFFASTANAATYKASTTEVLNVRTGPSTKYARSGKLAKGAVVTVYEQSNGWSRIGTKKWVISDYLKKKIASAAPATPAAPVAVVKVAKVETDAVGNWVPDLSDAAAPAATSSASAPQQSSTQFSLDCKRAIAAANSYCSKIASGCPSYSKTPRCVEANASCEARQVEALASCPPTQ